MSSRPTNVAVLGSTGSIGVNTLSVIEAAGERFRVVGLSAHRKTGLAMEQARRFRPRWLAITDPAAAEHVSPGDLPGETQLLVSHEALENVVREGGQAAEIEQLDVVVAAIVGSAGLRSTWAALEGGCTVALANKETLVMAGPLVVELAAKTMARLVPVDSEHSAVFQCLHAGHRSELKRIILTASGGPFRRHSAGELARVTPEEALRHPNWRMGPKITVDSATMMNKALEIIEARWLFDLQPEQIEVVVHPQSIVHSLVEFVDGSVIAQMSPPDMKLPIQYALSYPERWPGLSPRMDFGVPMELEFEPPDFERFGALSLGLEAAKAGGTVGCVLNAANEAAVGQFLAGELPFTEIVPLCRRMIDHHTFEAHPTLERLFELDRWARQEAASWAHT
jgi:1-deoxy-D-xylulose-5-phosphate reductoisomerase